MYYEKLDERQTRELLRKYSREQMIDTLIFGPLALVASAVFVFALLLLGF